MYEIVMAHSCYCACIYTQIMQQPVKAVHIIVIVFMIICVSNYLHYSGRHLILIDDNTGNSENASTSLTYGSSQVNLIQGGHVSRDARRKPFISKVGKATQLKDAPKNTTYLQGQYSPELLNVTSAPTEAHTADKESKGYILPYSIFEEQTNGANNLWQLQLWAKQVGMHVVEPFAKDSIFAMNTIIPNFSQALRFGDYYDKEEWDRKVMKAGGNPLVKWEEFIANYPRDAIILHTLKRANINPPLTIAYDENATVCKERQITPSDMLWIKRNFNIVKTICYFCDTNVQHAVSLERFNSLIFYDNGLKPNQVTLIVVNWLGMRKARIHVNPLTLFTSALEQRIVFPPSQRVMATYKAYIQRYIGDHKYVGIVFRTHHVMYFSPLKGSFANQSKYLLQCSKNLSKVLDKVRRTWKIFLAYDMGIFGSKKYVKNKQLVPLQKQIILDVFNGSVQVNEREENLRKAANGATDRGLIAQLEKVIATNADCIILVGKGSTFVRSSSSMYISQHSGDKCVVSICSEKVHDHRKVISSDYIPSKFIND